MTAKYYNDGTIESDPEKRGGEPVFPGTRVPIWFVFSGAWSGYTKADFFEGWDTPTEEQWVNVLNAGERELLKNHPNARFSGTDVPITRLFEFLRNGYSYNDFMKAHPVVAKDEIVLVIKGAEASLMKSLPLEFVTDSGYEYEDRYK